MPEQERTIKERTIKERTIMATTDETLQWEVLQELRRDARLQPNELGVAVKDGIVTLTGTVDSYFKKYEAAEATERVRGVKAVANDTQVRLPGMGERTDTDVARAAREALQWDVAVPADGVKITVSNGWVTLDGQVDFGFQKQAAERAIYRLAGVKGVNNLIAVTARVPVGAVKQDIEQALLRQARMDAHNIQVAVEGRKVILRGTVSSYAEKEAAEDTAWLEPGVTEIENDISVA
jgi:osmotically-inducible protein OsmY